MSEVKDFNDDAVGQQERGVIPGPDENPLFHRFHQQKSQHGCHQELLGLGSQLQ